MTRRPLLAIVSILATLSLVVAACSNTPAAPALTDPNEILAKTVESMKGVTTVQVIGSLTGELEMAELGGTELDLSTTTIAATFDIPNEKGKLVIDAPSLLGTKLEALVVDGFAYVKVDGPAGRVPWRRGWQVHEEGHPGGYRRHGQRSVAASRGSRQGPRQPRRAAGAGEAGGREVRRSGLLPHPNHR